MPREPDTYVAYHSAAVMGRQYEGGRDFVFFSRKPEKLLRRSIGQEVWVIASDGERPARYFLNGMYTPRTINAEADGWHIVGEGLPFDPPVEVSELPWFRALRTEQNNFSYGFNQIRSTDVIEALRRYRDAEPGNSIYPDDLRHGPFFEGASLHVFVNKYERDRTARAACLQALGTSCYICKTDLSDIYGEIAVGLIHVHHLKPLHSVNGEYQIDPVKDLIPICPNCHAVVHRRDPPLSPEALRELLDKRR